MAAHTIRVNGPNGAMREGICGSAATIKPGMLVYESADGTFNVHASAAGVGIPYLVHEDALQGNITSTAYTAGDKIPHIEAVPRGARRLVLVVSGEAIAFGDKLVSNGDGKFKETTGNPVGVFAIAKEAPGSLSGDTLVEADFL